MTHSLLKTFEKARTFFRKPGEQAHPQNPLPIVEVWCSGYLVTGMEGIPAKAELLGKYHAHTFDEAVEMWIKDKKPDVSYIGRDNAGWYYWACRLFDNEAAARRAFG